MRTTKIVHPYKYKKVIYLDRISAFTKSVLGFEAATAVSTVFPISSSPSSVMNRIEPIAAYVNNKIMTPENRTTDNKTKMFVKNGFKIPN